MPAAHCLRCVGAGIPHPFQLLLRLKLLKPPGVLQRGVPDPILRMPIPGMDAHGGRLARSHPIGCVARHRLDARTPAASIATRQGALPITR